MTIKVSSNLLNKNVKAGNNKIGIQDLNQNTIAGRNDGPRREIVMISEEESQGLDYDQRSSTPFHAIAKPPSRLSNIESDQKPEKSARDFKRIEIIETS